MPRIVARVGLVIGLFISDASQDLASIYTHLDKAGRREPWFDNSSPGLG